MHTQLWSNCWVKQRFTITTTPCRLTQSKRRLLILKHTWQLLGLWTTINEVRLLTDGRNYACWCHSRLGPYINSTHKPQNSTDDFSVQLSPCMCIRSSCPGWRNSCNLMAYVRPSYRTLPTYMSSRLGPHTSATALHTHVCMLVCLLTVIYTCHTHFMFSQVQRQHERDPEWRRLKLKHVWQLASGMCKSSPNTRPKLLVLLLDIVPISHGSL